jgi:hypothetical protein
LPRRVTVKRTPARLTRHCAGALRFADFFFAIDVSRFHTELSHHILNFSRNP